MTLLDIVAARGVSKYDVGLVKLDIEGAECEVISWMIKEQFLPRQLLVEFDEVNVSESGSEEKMKQLI